MPYNKSALKRYWVIDEALRNERRRYPDRKVLLSEIRQKIGVTISESMLYKDLFDMRVNFGAPVSYSKVNKGYYYDYPEYSFKGISLTEDEINALIVVSQKLPKSISKTTAKDYLTAINKIVNSNQI